MDIKKYDVIYLLILLNIIMTTVECVQYNVEGDIDFFKELKNLSASASTPSTATATATAAATETDASEQKYCLITDEVLRPDAVTLKCGHSFNYVPLYKEVLFQKCSTLPKNISSKIMALYTKTINPNIGYPTSIQNVQAVTYNSSINLETTKLHYDEIKCPYCRDITPKLLPYYPYPEVNQVKYVNSPSSLCLKGVACEYYKMFPAKAGKTNDNNADKTCEFCPTYNAQYGLLCRTHMKRVCAVKTSTSTTTAAAAAAAKPRKTKSVNSVVSHIDPSTLPTEPIYTDADTTTKCGVLLLTGPRKGQPCGCNVLKTAAVCKRHYNK